MGRYVFELDKDRVYEILKENTLFCVAFNDFPEWKEIVEEWDFEKIWNALLDNTFLQKGLLYSTENEVVFFLGSQANPKKEQRETICDRMGFSPHGNEIPVFFVDTSISKNRSDGTLFTTKGIYRKHKGSIMYSVDMPVRIEDNMLCHELYVKHTKVLDYNGSGGVFQDVIELFEILFIFCCVRHEVTEEIYRKDESDKSQKYSESAQNNNVTMQPDDSGVGNNSGVSSLAGIIFWIIVIIFIFRGCSHKEKTQKKEVSQVQTEAVQEKETVENTCWYCGNGSGAAYITSTGNYSYVCDECSKYCMSCGESYAAYHYTADSGYAEGQEYFVCEECAEGVKGLKEVDDYDE